MKLFGLAVISLLCALNQALTFSTVATVSLALFSLNKPVSCFFGIFRRRSSPVQETVVPEPEFPFNFFNQRTTAGFNPFGFGAGGVLFPGFGAPGFNMFAPSNRFPPRFTPAPSGKTPQPNREVPSGMFPAMSPQSSHIPVQFSQQVPSDAGFRDPREDVPGMNTEEAESFFTLLAETDESKCISRLVCEMGANPQSGGEFGQTVVEIIASLNDFPDGSKVSEYNEVLNLGVSEGLSACMSRFSICDEESYQLVKKAQVENE